MSLTLRDIVMTTILAIPSRPSTATKKMSLYVLTPIRCTCTHYTYIDCQGQILVLNIKSNYNDMAAMPSYLSFKLAARKAMHACRAWEYVTKCDQL